MFSARIFFPVRMAIPIRTPTIDISMDPVPSELLLQGRGEVRPIYIIDQWKIDVRGKGKRHRDDEG